MSNVSDNAPNDPPASSAPVSEAARRTIVRESFSPSTPDTVKDRVIVAIFEALDCEDE